MLLLAGTYLSTFRETIAYRDKSTGEQTSFEKVEVYLLDHQGRPHTLSVGRSFDESVMGARGSQVFVTIRPSVFRNEVQLAIESVLTAEQARAAVGLGGPGLRAASAGDQSKTA